MDLLSLPGELIISIAHCLKQSKSLSCFARTNRHVYSLVMPLLYQRDIKYSGCSGLKAQLTPLGIENSMSRFFVWEDEDLNEYNNPSKITAEGLPIPVTDKVRIRDIVIGQFVKHGACLDNLHLFDDDQEQSLLHYYAHMRNAVAVFLMVKHGADVRAISGYENGTALHAASRTGCAKIIRFLIQKGADVNARDWEQKTPLHFAAAEGQIAAIRLLFENGADINAQDESGYTPLHLMMMNGKPAPDLWCIPALKVMLGLGPNTNLGIFEDNKTPLHIAILNQRDDEFIEILLNFGLDLNSRTVEGRTPLSCCVEIGEMRVFMALLKAGANVQSRDEDGRSLLQIALEDEDRAYGCLPTLLENGLFSLDSDAGDGMTLVQFLKDRDWLYTIENRVDGMPELDAL